MTERLSVIVPVFNEERTVGPVIERLLTIDLPLDREIIVIDDGSRDGTRAVLEDVRARHADVRVVFAGENRGKGSAVRLGIAHATGTIIAIQDADLELDPAELGALAQPILRGEVQHARSVRYYSGRETLRWDLLDEAWLDRAVDWLEARGRRPYVLIEDWEIASFVQRFGERNRLAGLVVTPLLVWESTHTPGEISLYDPLRDRTTVRPGPAVDHDEPFCAPPAAAPWPR